MIRDRDLPPGPFLYETTADLDGHHGKGHVYIVDANGRKIGVLWGKPQEKMAMKDMILGARKRFA
jgi:hypothetical protein